MSLSSHLKIQDHILHQRRSGRRISSPGLCSIPNCPPMRRRKCSAPERAERVSTKDLENSCERMREWVQPHGLSLTNYFRSILVIAKSAKTTVTQVTRVSPFEEFDLAD